jgi:hypothetical protein
MSVTHKKKQDDVTSRRKQARVPSVVAVAGGRPGRGGSRQTGPRSRSTTIRSSEDHWRPTAPRRPPTPPRRPTRPRQMRGPTVLQHFLEGKIGKRRVMDRRRDDVVFGPVATCLDDEDRACGSAEMPHMIEPPASNPRCASPLLSTMIPPSPSTLFLGLCAP